MIYSFAGIVFSAIFVKILPQFTEGVCVSFYLLFLTLKFRILYSFYARHFFSSTENSIISTRFTKDIFIVEIVSYISWNLFLLFCVSTNTNNIYDNFSFILDCILMHLFPYYILEIIYITKVIINEEFKKKTRGPFHSAILYFVGTGTLLSLILKSINELMFLIFKGSM